MRKQQDRNINGRSSKDIVLLADYNIYIYTSRERESAYSAWRCGGRESSARDEMQRECTVRGVAMGERVFGERCGASARQRACQKIEYRFHSVCDLKKMKWNSVIQYIYRGSGDR